MLSRSNESNIQIQVIKILFATDTSLRLPTAGRFSMTSMVVLVSYGRTK